MSQELKVIIGICLATIVLLTTGILLVWNNETQQVNASQDPKIIAGNKNHTITAENAKITIVEFADFQCPACARTHPAMKRILTEYKGKVTFIYRHFPLPQHTNAISSAKAAEAAAEQGKFWEMYDLLYERQPEWSESTKSDEVFIGYAKELKLDINQFSKGMVKDTYTDLIQKDKTDALNLGVNSTPTIFINNQKLSIFPTYENLKKRIEEELQK